MTMNKSSSGRRQIPEPVSPKCEQCKMRKQVPGRADKLCNNCAHFKDLAANIAARK